MSALLQAEVELQCLKKIFTQKAFITNDTPQFYAFFLEKRIHLICAHAQIFACHFSKNGYSRLQSANFLEAVSFDITNCISQVY